MSASKTAEAKIQLARPDEKFDDKLARDLRDPAELAKQAKQVPLPPSSDIGPLYHSRHNYPTA